MVRRISESCRQHDRSISEAADALHAVDLQIENVEQTRGAVTQTLVEEGWEIETVVRLAEQWVQHGDFLLGPDLSETADFVLGNPPYVRLEDIGRARSDAYRRACPTMGGRADLFVGFLEAGLRALKSDGTLGYICADRWMHNQYGQALRELIANHFSVDASIVMHEVDAFEESVSAYPAITIIRRTEQGQAIVADTTARFGQDDAARISRWARNRRSKPISTDSFEIARLPRWFSGKGAWPSGRPDQLALVARLEAEFPPLQDSSTRTRVGIGVATGNDELFVTTDDQLVEAERLLPLSLVRDTSTGQFDWSGHMLVDPWGDDGLVDLDRFPLLRAYFGAHEAALRRRNVAARYADRWFRTIDRVDHDLTARSKLLFPDMKQTMAPVLESGGYYPHHNLYYVVSGEWPLEVLGGLLLSSIAELFVRTYAVKMRGGTLRFQAQYIRRIRVPRLDSIRSDDADALASAFDARDREAASEIAAKLYGTKSE
jgi:hypothetical protein